MLLGTFATRFGGLSLNKCFDYVACLLLQVGPHQTFGRGRTRVVSRCNHSAVAV